MHKVLICGSRDWHNWKAIRREIVKLVEKHGVSKLLVIHGGARGADMLADALARKLNVHCARVDALWDTRAGGAGPQRNAVMLALDPDLVLAFHEEIEKSKGTRDMVKRAWAAEIRVRIFSS